ncbi:MAG: hypoxanthine phosphoribosyltransferase [Clostridiales bacterium]|nr:hypoxanthine phosphoribosyltransferase [Clostridiales bacterium]
MDTSEILISQEEISGMVKRVASEINNDYCGVEELVVVPILTGAFIFASDLVRELKMPVNIDFMQVSSYVGENSTGVLKIKKDITVDIRGKDVLIVEDIIDTGRTLKLLKEMLAKKEPKSLKICTAFDKPDRRLNDLVPDYNGIVIPDKFIVGYGLDYNGQFRNYKDIRIVR